MIFAFEIVEPVTEVLGFADAIQDIVQTCINFLGVLLPSNLASVFAIAFTVSIAIAIKRGALV